jgi:hypothetical protein
MFKYVIIAKITFITALARSEMVPQQHRSEAEEMKPDSMTESGFRFVYSHLPHQGGSERLRTSFSGRDDQRRLIP